jgi:hypothetical protein
MLDVANGTPVLQLVDSETVHMVMHPYKDVDTDDKINEGTSNDKYISLPEKTY